MAFNSVEGITNIEPSSDVFIDIIFNYNFTFQGLYFYA